MDSKHRVTIEDIRKALETLDAQEPRRATLPDMKIIPCPFVSEGWTYLRSADKLASIDPEGNITVRDVPQFEFGPTTMDLLPDPHDDHMLRIVCRTSLRLIR